MRCVAAAVALAAVLTTAGCGVTEGTEPVGGPAAFATVTSVARPSPELVDWMNTVCGVTAWLDRPVSEDTDLTTTVPDLDAHLARLTALPPTNTAGDALTTDLKEALAAARPRLVTLTTGVPPHTAAAEVAALLEEARATNPSLTDLIAGNPVLHSAHTVARDCA